MPYKTCCFTGHRRLPPEEIPALAQAARGGNPPPLPRGFPLFCRRRRPGLRYPGRPRRPFPAKRTARPSSDSRPPLYRPDPRLAPAGRGPLRLHQTPGRQGGLYRPRIYPRLYAPAQPHPGGRERLLPELSDSPLRRHLLYRRILPQTGCSRHPFGSGAMNLIHSPASFCKKAVVNGEKHDIVTKKRLQIAIL